MPDEEKAHPPEDDDSTATLMRRLGLMVAVCVLFSMAARGLAETFTVFLLPLVEEFNTSRTSVMAVYSVQVLCSALAGPLVGHLFDRFGVLRLYLGGALLQMSGLVLAAFSDSLWLVFLGIGLCTGTASAALGSVPHGALLARWFDGRAYTRNMSLVFAGTGLGSLVLVPLSQWLIGHYGWRHAYLILAGLLLIVLLLSLQLINWRRAQAGSPQWQARRQAVPVQIPAQELDTATLNDDALRSQEGPSLVQALRVPAFWGLASVYFFTSTGMYSVMVQAVAYLVENGFAPLQAASIYGLIGLLTPVGMIGFSWLDGRIGRQASVLLSYLLSLSGLIALFLLQWWPSIPLLWAFVLCVGFSFGARAPLIASTTARIFQGRHLGVILGCVTLGAGSGMFAGSLMGAFLHDVTGGYVAVFCYSAISLLIGVLPFLTVRALRGAI
ncbi:MFS transporter [Ferrovibrio sp.]|uniref:MFS transporter n=1 Tax=Ferrovibrio sp. TaxID=1917215 RepID=UPI0025C2BD1B|nr:MFS transporter [Ferrovibrio sp.]MBX3453153.1 MFS transporter [Ferrovibrio sp.]